MDNAGTEFFQFPAVLFVMRRTKIVATVGPASDSEETLSALIEAGVNVFRLNFSHGTADEQRQRAFRIRELAAARGCHVALLGDLQGPKIRLRKLPGDAIELKKGQALVLDTALKDGEGDSGHIGVDYEPLARSVSAGDTLLLDDGRFRLEVEGVAGSRVNTVSRSAGTLKSRKGINRMGGGLSAPALTAKDLEDVKIVAAIALDYVAISFPSGAADIEYARSELDKAGCIAHVIGKVERAEAVADDATLDALIEACDGIMVARGDLGVEIGDANLIAYQKHMIKRARQLNRMVITATQMMESMISNPLPTRAEVFDVANAVLDGTDAVMLSAETAAGQFPVETVEAMAGTCVGAEQSPSIQRSGHRMDRKFNNVEEAIAMGAMYTANHLEGVKAIIALTESGRTPLLMSRISSGLPIYAVSSHQTTCNRVCLYRGVAPVYLDTSRFAKDELVTAVVGHLCGEGLIETGDTVLVSHGDTAGVGGCTNSVKIVTV